MMFAFDIEYWSHAHGRLRQCDRAAAVFLFQLIDNVAMIWIVVTGGLRWRH
jgi:hypothetical protein